MTRRDYPQVTESIAFGRTRHASAEPDLATRRRALVGSAIGSAVEWYDYFLYGTMAGIVFGPLFFPSTDPNVSLMLSFASFALAFVVRPVGGIVFSHIGDRIGRKKTLVVTLSLMGGSTMLIGFLPQYAAIGNWAPILLTVLRLIQGLALGGEWGGGLLLAVEYAPKSRRGLYGAVPQTGALFGLGLGSLAASVTSSVFTDAQFRGFGWRIPFVLSFVLVLIGLWIRNRVDETPSFRKVKSEARAVKAPIVETLKHHWRAVLITIGAKFIETSTFFIFATFTISYAARLGYSRGDILNAVLLAAVLAIPAMLFFGSLSDRIGRKKVYIGGVILMAIYAGPYFWLLSHKSVLLLNVACIVGFSIIWSTYGSVLGTLFAESFSANVRYTGISLGYQIGAALVGGPAPLIATALLVAFNDHYAPVAIFVIACAAVSLVAISFAKEMRGVDLDA
ncbi:MHS family MFS transporter [Paraburkholderia sp. MMS20-SJTR3]|uniref:MHS family MFS transporter n=1 Tax=Paraburkholderia sejongensis TaxID=2886946 RepID=A0ABS8K604_9BURK|nr:MFS transporter [Paraburkholderia sp. MMS20-SJTR3]MCC8397374.1 MHS family MFS transporter [Paraburkholderia sp. MMS20-SJTR3]